MIKSDQRKRTRQKKKRRRTKDKKQWNNYLKKHKREFCVGCVSFFSDLLLVAVFVFFLFLLFCFSFLYNARLRSSSQLSAGYLARVSAAVERPSRAAVQISGPGYTMPLPGPGSVPVLRQPFGGQKKKMKNKNKNYVFKFIFS